MRTSSLIAWAGIVVIALAAFVPGAEGDWPGWLGPNRDGKSADTGLLKSWPDSGPKLLWKNGEIGKGFSAVAVADGTIYTCGDVGETLKLFALDMNGKIRWQSSVGPAWKRNHPGSRCTPVVDGERIYIVSATGIVACYDAAGQRKWTRRMSEFGGSAPNWGYAESVLIYEDLAIITPGGKNCIVALDKNTGRDVWTSSGFEAAAHYGSCIAVTFEGTTMIIAGTAGGIVAVSAKDGSTLWSNRFAAGNTANCPTPAYADGYVFWANGYGKGGICLKLSVADGKVTAEEVYKTREMVCHHGGYVIHEGHVYGNNGGGWACIGLKTGKTVWTDKAVGKGSLCFADGMLYLFGERGGRAALGTCSPAGLKIAGTVSVAGSGPSWAHPVVAGGRLYLRYGTNLHCFDVRQQ